MSSESSDEIFPILEYARSSRSSCRICKKKILVNSIRVGKPSKFRRDDGEVINTYQWRHLDCAWEKEPNLVLLALEHNCLLRAEDKALVVQEAKRRGLLGFDPDELVSIRDLFVPRSIASFRGRVVETFFSRDLIDSESPFVLYVVDPSNNDLDFTVKIVFRDVKKGLELFSKIKEGDVIEVKRCPLEYPYGTCPVAVFTSSSSLRVLT